MSSQISLQSTELQTKESMENAYVPYLYAKGCVAKMVQDMKNMIEKHKKITYGIETHYRRIEDETQVITLKKI